MTLSRGATQGTWPGLPPHHLAQPLHVPHGGLSEQPLVLPAELRGVVVAHPGAGAGRVQVLAEHDAPGLLEPEVLLDCKGLIAVTALKWWWKSETLIPSSCVRLSNRSGWVPGTQW